MANCKICGRSVMAGVVMHSDCLERQISMIAEKFCDNYCHWPDNCGSQEQMHNEYCESCPIGQLIKLAKRAED